MNLERIGFMMQAIDEAKRGIMEGGGPFGAVIVKDNRIIASTQRSNHLVRPDGTC